MPPKTKTRESIAEKEKDTSSSVQPPAAVSAALQVNNSISIDCETSGPTPIIKLDKSCGIGNADLKKLQEAGFCTVESIAFAPRKSLLAVKGISDAKADKLAVSFVFLEIKERLNNVLRLKQLNLYQWVLQQLLNIIKNVRK
jgi:predicted flap endonuclease-1-like 5' DNA nuclease